MKIKTDTVLGNSTKIQILQMQRKIKQPIITVMHDKTKTDKK
jgi:hypothetical protein